MSDAETQTKAQLVQVINHYGLDATIAIFAAAVTEVGDSLEGIGADAITVQNHKNVGTILANFVGN